MASLEHARPFVYSEARLLDRHAFTAAFEDGDPHAVVAALAAYQNADGGFGHGLEPDTRTPTSQPLYVEVGLQYMADAGVVDHAMVARACDFLASNAGAEGATPILLPSYKAFPHAAHWERVDATPRISPNGGIAGLLHGLGVEHPYLARLDAFCWEALGELDDAHDVSEATIFLGYVPDRARAVPIAERLIQSLPATPFFKVNPAAEGYGLDALNFAPAPDSFCRQFFTDEAIDHALEHRASQQQPDGGWPITWTPPGKAAASEWRAIVTVKTLRVLRAYGRL
jgi:hypothetical protein